MTAACNDCSRAKYREGAVAEHQAGWEHFTVSCPCLAQPLLSHRSTALSHPPLTPWGEPTPEGQGWSHHQDTSLALWFGTCWHCVAQGRPDLPLTTGSFSGTFALVKSMKYIFMEGSEQCWWAPFTTPCTFSLLYLFVKCLYPTSVEVVSLTLMSDWISCLLKSLTVSAFPVPHSCPRAGLHRVLVFLKIFKRNIQKGVEEI